LLPLIYLSGRSFTAKGGGQSVRATGLEWKTPSPPPKHNFDETPVVTGEPYNYPPLAESGEPLPQHA